MDIPREFVIGAIKIHVLYHAQKAEFCGIDIMELNRHGYRIGPGILYPMLHKMREDGYLKRQEKVENGKRRIYYRATDKGKQAFYNVRPKISELVSEVIEGK